LNSDGSFTYTPDIGFVGFDNFSYVATDGFETSLNTNVQVVVSFPVGGGGNIGGKPPSIIPPPDGSGDQENDDLVLPALTPSEAKVHTVAPAAGTTSNGRRHEPLRSPTSYAMRDLGPEQLPNDDASYYRNVLPIEDLVRVLQDSADSVAQTANSAFSTSWLWGQMAEVAEQLENNVRTATLGQIVLQVSATTLGLGYVIWSVRSGYLLASMLSALPAWRRFDPLPVLDFAAARRRSKEDKNSGGTLVEKIQSEHFATV
jgi:hypothetical protein